MAASLYLPTASFSFRFLRLAQKNRANGKWQIVFFDRSDGGKDDQNKEIPRTTSYIWTSPTCRINSRVNCMCGTRVNVLLKSPETQTIIPVQHVQGVMPRFHHFGPWPLSQDTDIKVYKKTYSAFSCTPYLSLELRTGSKLSFLPLNGPSARR
jgi:hypothetical protein